MTICYILTKITLSSDNFDNEFCLFKEYAHVNGNDGSTMDKILSEENF